MKRPIAGQSARNQPAARRWQQEWLGLLKELNLPSEPGALRKEVQGCRVRQLELALGQVAADVVHNVLGDCTVVIEIAELSDDQWTAVLDVMGGQTALTARLLTGQVPENVEKSFAAAGTALMPSSLDDLHFVCSCCSADEIPCQPALTAFLAVSEMLEDDPWLIFRLRGRDRQQIMRELNAVRSRTSGSDAQSRSINEQSLVYRAGGAPAQLEDTPLLDEEIDHFWGRSRQQLLFQPHIAAPQIELVLLRRLGPPYFADDEFDVYENLTEIYRQVTDASLALAYSPIDDPDVDEKE